MKTLVDRKELFASASRSPISTSHSMSSSFSSGRSWDSSSLASTPASCQELPFNSVKVEGASFPAPTPCTLDGYGSGHDFMQMSFMTQEMLSVFQDPSMLFVGGNPKMLADHDMSGYSNFSTYNGPIGDPSDTNHGLPTPSMDLDLYSPTPLSQISVDCVAPSQTTFLDPFDMQSPVRTARSLHFDLNYDSSASEYATDYSFGVSPNESFESFNSSISDPSSASNTPSRQALIRPPTFESLQTSSALYCVQQTEQGNTQAPVARQARRRTKRESRNRMIPDNIRVQKEAKKKCTWRGCNSRFQRQEHLKRHEKTHTGEEAHLCQFCPKKFGRGDNLKSHIKLHADPPKKSSRTEHFTEAIEVYEQMDRKPRKLGELGMKREGKITRARFSGP